MSEVEEVNTQAGINLSLSTLVVLFLGMLATVVLTAVVTVGGVYFFLLDGRAPAPAPAPVVTTPQITEILAGSPEDADRIAGVLRGLADVTEGDKSLTLIQSNTDLRQAIGIAGQLGFGHELKGKYPGLADAINAELVKAIGLEAVKLNDDLRAKAVAALRSAADQADAAR